MTFKHITSQRQEIKQIPLIISLALLSACVTTPSYKPPAEGEPSAEIRKQKDGSIRTFLENGCPETYSSLINGMRVHAEKLAHIGYYEKVGSDHYCSLAFSFIPEQDAVYELTTQLVRDPSKNSWIPIGLFSGAKCYAGILKINPDGTKSLIEVKKEDPDNIRRKCKPS